MKFRHINQKGIVRREKYLPKGKSVRHFQNLISIWRKSSPHKMAASNMAKTSPHGNDDFTMAKNPFVLPAGYFTGSTTLNSVKPSLQSTQIFPPWALTVAFAMESPRP